MVGFFFVLLFISSVAAAVLVAFALPNLRGGARVLTPEGERLAQRWAGRIRPVVRVVRPWARPVVVPLVRLARRFAGPVVAPLARRLRPVTDAFLRASFEGVGPVVRSTARPAPAPAPAEQRIVVDLLDEAVPPAAAGSGRR